ncbi:hypothetical protein AB0N17_31895 [Streptomyces sp. NPDC051133]|uniref:hypothetical protein n=1 Tax=Streptomyces sp. NPDC051133 TaxID=3155521 RepID=UPI00341CEAFE
MTRSIKALAALAIAGASILGVTSQASADPNSNNHGSNPQWATLDTPYHVGVYTCPYATCGKADDLTLSPPNDQVLVDCWVSGGYVGTTGDVWYRTSAVIANGIYVDEPYTWTYGPYVDGDLRFRLSPGGLPHC